MARRRREAALEEPGTATEQPTEGAEPQLRVQMTGTADQVKRQLGVAVEDKPEKLEKLETNGQDDEKKKFVEALRNPKYIIRVKRSTPREFNGVKTNFEVWQAELPLSYQEIQEEVTKTSGGGKYRVAVVDPSSNNTIAADTFEVDGDPIVPELNMTQEEQDRIFMQGKPKTAADISEESLERRARVAAKMSEVEALEAQLEEARARRSKPAEKSTAQDDTRIADLDRRLIEAKHSAELEARDRKHADELRELKALIAQNAKPQKSETDSTMTILLEQMREDRKANQAQFTALLTQMKDDKMNAVLDEVKSLKNKPAQQSGSLLEQAEAMLKMKKIFGWGGDEDDEDEEDDKDDDRPWWERALDKLGGKFGDKLIAKFTDMEEKGEKVSREEFMKNMGEYADQLAADGVRKQQQRLPGPPPAAPPPLPAPPPPAANPQSPVTVLPPPPPAAAPPPAATPPAAPLPQTLTVEQEIVIRVGGVLEMLEREIELRPNEYHWNYEGAFLAVPATILEKICAAPDPITMLDAFTIPHISPEKLAEMKAKISGNPKILAWVKAGHDELKEWAKQKEADPSFDPFADEDEGEEG